MKVLFYVSGHGYGHATRMTAVMNALRRLRPDVEITVRSEAPEWVFRTSVPGPVRVESAWIDSGVIERDLLAQDAPATLERAEKLFRASDAVVAAETRLVRERRFDRIISDIPPLASCVGAEAGVPVIAIGNFTWDEIYAPFIAQSPQHSWLRAEIRAAYARTDLLLQLPWSLSMEPFPRRQAIPLIARTPRESRAETRRDLERAGVPGGKPWVLLGGRFPNLDPAVIGRVLESGRYTVVSFTPLPASAAAGLINLGTEWQDRFVEVLEAADVVVTKLGYGIASEAAASRTPVLYPPRELFAEHPAVEAGLASVVPIRRIERADFEAGNWIEPLEQLLAMPKLATELDTSGAEAAATIIAEY